MNSTFYDIDDLSCPTSTSSGYHRRNGIYIPHEEAIKLLDNLLNKNVDSTQLISSHQWVQPGQLDPLGFSNRSSSDCGADITSTRPPSGLNHGDLLPVCDQDDLKSEHTPLTEDEFIESIGRAFSLPHANGELDWLKNTDPDLYVNPKDALLQSAFEQPSSDACAPLESFLNMDDEEDDDTEIESEDETLQASDRYHSSFSCNVDMCSLRHEKIVIRVVLPQVFQHDTWKRPNQQPYIPPKRKFLARSLDIFKTFAHALFRKWI